jgi:magnesium-transporting ATPase (P-type)
VDDATYTQWAKRYAQALVMINGKEARMTELHEELEQDFELLGSTAIEDMLQDDVGPTIRDLKIAGIQIWVLTGDKIETAINIGFSCQLLTNDMNMFLIKELKPKKILVELTQAIAT